MNGGFDGNSWSASGAVVDCISPHDNSLIAKVRHCTLQDYERSIESMQKAYPQWAQMPIPFRGEIVRQIGNALRENLTNLGKLESIEMGKILSEGIGEVQETIDICDFACGLSRSING